MAYALENEHCCVKLCWGVFEQSSIVNSCQCSGWSAERAIIVSNKNDNNANFVYSEKNSGTKSDIYESGELRTNSALLWNQFLA